MWWKRLTIDMLLHQKLKTELNLIQFSKLVGRMVFIHKKMRKQEKFLTLLLIIYRKSLSLSVLTERRVLAPYGMAGGRPGLRGQNSLVKSYFPYFPNWR